jgi:hypothetical protein
MNRATRINVIALAVLLAISGMMAHGLFEVLQGNTPTNGLFIEAIGEAHRTWEHGAEGAFTIIPNFLITGLLAMTVSLGIIIWSVGFVHKKNGPLVLLLFFILLFLVGGGVAQILFFIPLWAVATRINKPLSWWRRILPAGPRRVLAELWPWFLVAGAVLFVIGLVISITGYVPGLSDPEQILTIDWSILGIGYLLYLLAFFAGFAYDIQRQPDSHENLGKEKEQT